MILIRWCCLTEQLHFLNVYEFAEWGGQQQRATLDALKMHAGNAAMRILAARIT